MAFGTGGRNERGMMEKTMATDAAARAFREGRGRSTTGARGAQSGARRGIAGGAGKGS
ncbi:MULTISPECIES: hypothetical protein [unclassified Streptomyces]|uniref:hypothetical protein n=1 Tax=unclassified Streptomyces TaxID=2593676 RepID=UPI0033265F93